tara:strand:- start:444 stop:884 length:441 start_codon:yes stop_codon:yes gene_type:complete
MFKKKYLLLTLFLIIILQTLLYTNNNQTTSFRFLKLSVKEVSIGKLISISFFSGLFISALLNTSNISYKKYNFENKEENNESFNDEIDMKSNFEMPPQRDIREAQPTVSVNYRVIKNTNENNLKNDEYYSDKFDNEDDWENNENEW